MTASKSTCEISLSMDQRHRFAEKYDTVTKLRSNANDTVLLSENLPGGYRRSQPRGMRIVGEDRLDLVYGRRGIEGHLDEVGATFFFNPHILFVERRRR